MQRAEMGKADFTSFLLIKDQDVFGSVDMRFKKENGSGSEKVLIEYKSLYTLMLVFQIFPF